MALAHWLVLAPRIWQEQLPRLAHREDLGIAHLARNFFPDRHEFIAWDLHPVTPAAEGRQFGPLDDLLVLQLQPRVGPGDAGRLLQRFGPLPRQLIVLLILGREQAAGQWLGTVWEGEDAQPLAGFTLVGPGMRQVTAQSPGPDTEPGPASERWSRTRGALGDAVWRRLRRSRVAVIGAGRNGSAAALTLAMLGVGGLVLIDADRDELSNLDATLGATVAGLGRAKVSNRQEALHRLRPDDLDVRALARSVLDPGTAEALRPVDLLVTCVDRDAPRLAAARLANRWCKVHLDVGTGIFPAGAGRRRGGDVRLLLPGEACVTCLGGLRDPEGARAEVAAPPGALRRGRPRAWHQERAGSLVSVNQVAVNLGVQLWLDLLGGLVTGSRWLRLEWGPDGLPALHIETTPATTCDLCRDSARRSSLPAG